MAQLPDDNMMDEKVSSSYNKTEEEEKKDDTHYNASSHYNNNNETKVNDTSSMTKNVDYTANLLLMDLTANSSNAHHAIINDRSRAHNAPEPPNTSSQLTIGSLEQFNSMNPPTTKLAGLDDLMSIPYTNSNNHNNHSIMDNNNNHTSEPPDIMVAQLTEMGFPRNRAVYALQQSDRVLSMFDIDFAVTWLMENNAMDPHNSPNHHSNNNSNIQGNINNNAIHDMLNSMPLNNSNYNHNNHNNEEKESKTSTVASEMSQISQLSHVSGNGNNGNHNNKTSSEFIASLYEQQNMGNGNVNMHNQSYAMTDIPSDLKMVIVVRRDLKMGAGKVAAQCCHACLGVVLDIINGQHIHFDSNNGNDGNDNSKPMYDLRNLLNVWRRKCGEKKIVLSCENEEKLMKLRDEAMIANLPNYLVTDAGHTQVKSGTKTVIAIGPYVCNEIDQITGNLKLY